MIVSIAWIVLCFVWLLIESDWLRVRLPVGNLPVKRNGRWQFGRFGDDCVMMRDRCYAEKCRECRKGDRIFAWRIPARTVKLYGSVITFKAGCNLYRAKLLKDIIREHKRKTSRPASRPLPLLFIARTDGKIVCDDCLPGKKWVKAHYKDKYPESTMELRVDGKMALSLNGDYKKGMIQTALKPYTTKARVGKHNVVWDFGEADRVKA